MKKTRKKHSTTFKTKVVLEALKERQTIGDLAQKYELHPTQIANWKKEFLQKAELVFSGPKPIDNEKEKDELYKQIGQMKVEIDWLKKKVL
jgi:transposase